jgi:hypothetical protein
MARQDIADHCSIPITRSGDHKNLTRGHLDLLTF